MADTGFRPWENAKKYPKTLIVPATIDEIMLLYVKGEKAEN